MAKLENRTAIVTGGSKGIGTAIARRLAADGATVVVTFASDKEGAEKVVRDVTGAGGRAIAVRANASLERDVAELFTITREKFGRLDILVNNAGVYGRAAIEALSVESYRRTFDTNVLGVLLATRAAVPLFPPSGGSVINIGSVASLLAPAGDSLYAASKGAVDTLTRALAKELGPRKIRVNVVSPGLVATQGYDAGGFANSEFEKQGLAATPLGRVGQPEDIALAVAFLASDDARWITGEIVRASGGLAT